MLTSATREETLTPDPNECNSTLTSGTRGIYPHRYILMLMSGVTAYVFSTRGGRRTFLYSMESDSGQYSGFFSWSRL